MKLKGRVVRAGAAALAVGALGLLAACTPMPEPEPEPPGIGHCEEALALDASVTFEGTRCFEDWATTRGKHTDNLGIVFLMQHDGTRWYLRDTGPGACERQNVPEHVRPNIDCI